MMKLVVTPRPIFPFSNGKDFKRSINNHVVRRLALFFSACLLLGLLAFNNNANAANISSTTTGGVWSATTTWVGGVVPGAGDNVTIVSGATVNVNGNVSVANLQVNAGGTLTGAINRELTIGPAGNITTDGVAGTATITARILFTTASSLTITTNTTTLLINATNGFINGTTSAGTLAIGGTGNCSISAVIGGLVSSITKSGTGTLTLSGANLYTGSTAINAGVLNIQNATATGTTAGGVTVASGAALEIQGGITVGAEALSLAGTGISGNGAFRNISGINIWRGTITQTAASSIQSDAGSITLNTAANSITGTFPLTLQGAGTGTISGTITIGTGTLTKAGAGTWTLAGANTYTGLTTISAGTLRYGASNVLSTGAVTVNGGTFDIVSFSDAVGAVTLISGAISGTTGILTGTSYSLENGTVSAILAGGIGVPLTKSTAGTVTMSGGNTYQGVTTINAGTLSVATIGAGGAAGNLGQATAAASNLVLGGGTLQYTGATASTDRAYTLTAGTTSSIEITGGANTLTMSGAGAATTGALIKIGAGTLLLSGANAYTGGTTITGGTLTLGAPGVLADAGNVILNGGTFRTGAAGGFSETVNTLNLSAPSTIALGTGAHTLTFANSSGIVWSPTTLTINGWTGTAGATGTAGKIFFGATTGTLTGTQLAMISFTGFSACPSILLASGELVPAQATAGPASSTPTLCINTALTAITHTTTGATGIGSPTGLPAGVTAAWALNTITISGTPTASGTFNYTIPLTGGCGSVNATGTITVSINTAGAASSTPTLCINTPLSPDITHSTTGATGIGTASGLPAGVSASWSADVITISGTPTETGTFNYSIPLTGGCGTVSATGTIIVTPDKAAGAASSSPTLCINTPLSPVITHTTTGATGIGSPTGLPTGVTAGWASNTITISGTPSASGTFNYSIPLTGACVGSVNATGTIIVTPANTAGAASSTPTLCINTALTAITHTTTGATGIGAATNLPAGVTAAFASNTITISGTPAASGTFNYTIPLTGGCGSVNATGTITVTPNNTVGAASSSPTVCVNTALTAITHTTTGATGIGSPTGLPVGVTAAWATNTITISGTPTGAGTFNYTIPLTGGCGSVNATGTINVITSLSPTVISSAIAGNICSSVGIPVTVNSSSLSSGTYTITYDLLSATNVVVTAGLTASMTFNQGTGTGTFTTPVTAAVKVRITAIALGTCSSLITPNVVTNQMVNQAPSVTGANGWTMTGSTTDSNNPFGSTISVNARGSNFAAGTYQINYTINPGAITGSRIVEFTPGAKKNTFVTTFTTGPLPQGNYTISVNAPGSVSYFPSTNCSFNPNVINIPFVILAGGATISTIAPGTYSDGLTVWGLAGSGPTGLGGPIIINHNVTIDGTIFQAPDILSLNQLVVNAILTINANEILLINDDTGVPGFDITLGPNGRIVVMQNTTIGPDPVPGGTLIFSNNVTHQGMDVASKVTFAAGSFYRHQATGSNVLPPLALWNAASNFSVEGFTNLITDIPAATAGWGQSFGNFIWECPLQTTTLDLNANLTGIQGNLLVRNTGTGILRFVEDRVSYTLNVGGSFETSGTARFAFGPTSGQGPDATINITSNLLYASTGASFLCDRGTNNFNISGNVTMNSGTLYFSSGANLKTGATLNITGNLTVATNTFLEASDTNNDRIGKIVFNNSAGTHSFTNTGSINGQILWTIASNQTVRAVNESPISSAATSTGAFTIASGATLIVESVDPGGAIQAGTTAGNLRIAGTALARTFTSGSTIEYGRTFSAAGQFIGDGHPISSGVDCRINNAIGVTVSSTGSTVLVGGSLKMISGNLTVAENNVTVSQNIETIGVNSNIIVNPRASGLVTTALRADGAFNMTGGNVQMNSSATVNAANTSLLINGDLLGTNNFAFTGANCQVTVGGVTRTITRDFPISGATTLEQLTMDVTGGATTLVVPQNLTLGNYTSSSDTYSGGLILTSGNVRMNANLTVTTVTTLTSGILYFDGIRTVELRRNINTTFPSGVFASNNLSTLRITSDFNGVANTIAFSPSGNTLGTLILNRSSAASPNVTLNSALTIGTSLQLTDGEFYNQSGLAMGSGATITRTGQSAFASGSVVPTGGPYDVVYNDYTNPTTGTNTTTQSLSTGIEIQGSQLQNVTSNLTGTALLTTSLTGTGTLTINKGIFTCGAFPVSMNSASILVAPGPSTLNAPSSTLALTGTFTNNGTFNSNAGIVTFTGTTSIAGTSTTSFNNLSILSGTLTDNSTPKQFNVGLDFTNNGAFGANGGLVNFNGTATAIKGSNIISFNNLTISSGTLTDSSTPKQFNIGGTFQNNASFAANGGIVNFNNTNTFLSGSSATTFNNITIASGTLTSSATTALTPSNQFTVGSDFTNNATFAANGGTVNFAGTTSIKGSSATTFNNITIASGTLTLNATTALTPSNQFTVASDFTNNATFAANGGTVNFAGPTFIKGTGATTFNNITIASGTLTSSVTTALTPSNQFTIGSDFKNNAAFAANGGTVNFSGTSTFISGANTTNFNHILISSGTLTPTPTGLLIRVAGNFTNNFTFEPNGGTVEFNGTGTIGGSAVSTFNHLTLTAASTLNLPAGPINIKGSLESNGALNCGTGTVAFTGSTLQEIKGSTVTEFNNININNTLASPVSIESNQSIRGILTLAVNSNFDADGLGDGAVFTLLSNFDQPTVDASVAAIPPLPTAIFNGRITVQRYMRATGTVNRYISMPVTGVNLQDLSDDFYVYYGGRIYYEFVPGNLNNGYYQTNRIYNFVSGRGFLAYMWDGDDPGPFSWDVRGPLTNTQNRGDVNLNVTFTPSSAGVNHDGWNLVGNPYPSAIEWNNNLADWSWSNIDDVVYVPDLQGNVFRTWNRITLKGDLSGGLSGIPGAIGTGGNGMIALGQAFWVHANNVSPSLIVKESAKRSTAATFYRKSEAEIPTLKLALSNGSVEDYAFIFLQDKTTSGYDKGIDALKLEGNLMGISLFSDDLVKLVHYSTKELPDKEIPLNIMASQEGNFSIRFESSGGGDKFQGIYLLDRYTNTVYPIANDNPYEFEVTQNVLTKEGRFFLSKKASLEVVSESKVSIFPNPVSEKLNIEVNTKTNVPVSIYQMSGNSVLETILESRLGIARGSIDVKELPTGLYFIKTVVDGQVRVDKVIKR